jgi:hypothetical protein
MCFVARGDIGNKTEFFNPSLAQMKQKSIAIVKNNLSCLFMDKYIDY